MMSDTCAHGICINMEIQTHGRQCTTTGAQTCQLVRKIVLQICVQRQKIGGKLGNMTFPSVIRTDDYSKVANYAIIAHLLPIKEHERGPWITRMLSLVARLLHRSKQSL